jgi:hypothetical protein
MLGRITLRVQRDGRGFTIEVSSDGEGLVSHAGAALLAETADRVGLTRALSRALGGMRQRRGRHDPGRVVRDLAVMIADGGDCLSDLRAVRDQEPLFGPVASNATAFRVIDAIAEDRDLLDALRAARARARQHAWDAGVAPQQIIVDIDATLIGAHSEKEGAAGTFKGGFGFHPLLGYLDETREALAAVLRAGNAGANTAADHVEVIDLARLGGEPHLDLARLVVGIGLDPPAGVDVPAEDDPVRRLVGEHAGPSGTRCLDVAVVVVAALARLEHSSAIRRRQRPAAARRLAAVDDF